MHAAAKAQLDRQVGEYLTWMAVPERDRSPAPGWWWGPALALREMPGALPADLAQKLGLPEGAKPAEAAHLFFDAMADQTHLPWPEQFPRRYRHGGHDASDHSPDQTA